MNSLPKTTLLKQTTVCRDILGITPTGLETLIARDSTFPKKLKLGDTKQSPCYFDAAEIEAWLQSKKEARGTQS